MTAVVEKQFVWRFVDEVSAGLRQAQSLMEQTLEVFRSAGAIANESANGLNVFGDDAKSSAEKVNEAMNKCQSDINKVKESVNGLPKDKNVDIETKANISGVEEAENAINKVPKEKITEINAKANESAVDRFTEEVNKVPREKSTEINAKANDEAVNKFKEEINTTPKERITNLLAKISGNGIGSFKRSVEDIPEERTTTLKANTTDETKVKSFGETLKGTALGMGIYNVAMQAGTAVSEQFGSAISRYDQLQRFPRILEDMGSSAKDANASVKILSNGINGLPTSLDQMETSAQRFMPITNNAQLAAKSAVALNDALIASGATAQDASDGLKEWTEMLDEGKPKMMQWQELTRVMSPALQKVAKSFGIASGSTSELYKKLQSGQITMQQLNQHMLQLDQGTKGFASTAHDATAGIGTAFDNLKIRLTKALADAVGGFNNFVKVISGNSIAQNINNLSSKFTNMGKTVSKVFTDLGNAIKPFLPEIKQLLPVLGTFIGTLAGLTIAKALVSGIISLGSAIAGLASGPMLAVAAIAALIVGFKELYQHNTKFRKFVNDIVASIKTLVTNITKVAQAISKDFVGAFNKISAPVKKVFNDVIKYIQPDLKTIQKNISSAMTTIQKVWNSAWSGLEKVVSSVMSVISKFVQQHMTQIRSIIQSVTKIISTIWNTIWKQIENVFKLVWDSIFHQSRVINDVKNIISTGSKATQVIWQNVWNIVRNYFSMVWDAIKNIANSAINAVKNIISNVVHGIQNIWNSIWGAIRDYLRSVWDSIQSNVSHVMNGIHDTISSILDRISSVWHRMWDSMSDAFHGIWDKIKGYASDGMNGVIDVINAGINGIDSVWKFFTGHETSLHHLSHVKFATGGVVGGDQLSMVNDGGGSHWKELIEEPDGNMFMANQRNAILPLKPGTRVYNGEETHQIMSALGVEHYATGGIVGDDGLKHYKDGGVVGDLIDWGHHELSNLGSWIKDKWDAITKFLKYPLENTKEIIAKAITGPLGKLSNSNMVELGKGVFDKLTQPISDWFKKGLQDLKNKHDQEVEHGKGYFNGGAGVARWAPVIDKVSQEMGVHLTDDQKNRLLRQIATESGGNELITQQISDVNSAAGHPAQGLLQFIPSTFAHWALPGHTNINSGYDQIMAAINCLDHGGEGGWGNVGDGHGWATGGHITGLDLAWIGDNPEHEEFVINPFAPSARPLLKQAMDRTQSVQPVSQTDVSNSDSDNQIGERIVELLELILQKDSYVNLEDAGQRLRSNDAQSLRMVNMQRGV